MATNTETAYLDLAGNFRSQATANSAAAKELEGALGGLAKASAQVKGTGLEGKSLKMAGEVNAITAGLQKQVSLQAQIATFDAKRVQKTHELEQQLKRMHSAATGQDKIDAAKKKGDEQVAASAALSITAGNLMAGAAEKMIGAARDMVVAAYEYSKAAYSKAVTETTARAGATGGLDVLSKGHGNAAYNMAFDLAAKYNLSADEGVDKVKKLVNAHFASKDIPLAVRASVGVDGALGKGKGDELLKKLETAKLKGKKTGEETVKGLAELGIDAEEVYDQIAKDTGKTKKSVKAKAKANTLDTDAAVKAVLETANKKYGGIADKIGDSVPGLMNKISLGFNKLFSTVDLAPVQKMLKSIGEVINGPGGKEIQAAGNELFSALNDALFGQFQGKSGKKELVAFAHEVAGAIRMLAASARELKPTIAMLERLAMVKLKQAPGLLTGGVKAAAAEIGKAQKAPVSKAPTQADDVVGGLGELAGDLGGAMLGGPLKAVWDVFGFVAPKMQADVAAKAKSAAKDAGKAAIVGALSPAKSADPAAASATSKALPANDNAAFDTMGQGLELGNNLSVGMAAGIAGGQSAAVEAATSMASAALGAAKSTLQVASPSKAFGWVGDMSAQGFAGGMDGGGGAVSKAGQGLGKKALGGAAAGAGGAGGGAGASGGDINISVALTPPPGAKQAEVDTLMAMAESAAAAAFRKNQRNYQRGAREGVAA